MTDGVQKMVASGFAPKDIAVLVTKNATTEVWAYENEWKGKSYFHIREVYQQNGVWHPGKGISVPANLRQELLGSLWEMTIEAVQGQQQAA